MPAEARMAAAPVERPAPASAGRARPTPSGPLSTRGDPDKRGYPHRLSRSPFGSQFIQFETNLHMATAMFTVVATTPQPIEKCHEQCVVSSDFRGAIQPARGEVVQCHVRRVMLVATFGPCQPLPESFVQ